LIKCLLLANVLENFFKKFWPVNWREGTCLKGTKVRMIIDGDFILTTPLFIKEINNYNQQ